MADPELGRARFGAMRRRGRALPNEHTTTGPTLPTRVIVVEGHTMLAGAFAAACEGEHDLHVVGTAGGVASAAALVAATRPDVAVIDDHLPDGDAADVVVAMRRCHPSVRTLVVAGATDERSFRRAIEAQVEGYLLLEQELEQLLEGIRTLAAGGTAYAPSVLGRLSGRVSGRRPLPNDLSDREVQVLSMLAEGETTSEVAEHMHISVNTVRNHAQHVLQKLGVHSRLDAVATAIRAGIIPAR